MGYFAKDLDLITENAAKRVYYKAACGYLLNDNLSSDTMSDMIEAWDADMRLLRINQLREMPGMDALKKLSDTTEKTYNEADLRYEPCGSKKERERLLGKWRRRRRRESSSSLARRFSELYCRFPYGVHKFNTEMISRRRYEMLIDVRSRAHLTAFKHCMFTAASANRRLRARICAASAR